MDCISVFAAGFHNVIASSGTAFTELQARLLGRFSKNVVVNFDPDTAGARPPNARWPSCRRRIQHQSLDSRTGFDPDLFIRRKGKDAYAEALRHSQRYFDYLIERARAQFPVRSAEGKVKAVNHLLPHIQRIPAASCATNWPTRSRKSWHRFRRSPPGTEACREHTLGRGCQGSAATQITDAEKILIRALASAHQIQTNEEHVSARDGAEEEFDPARQAAFVLQNEALHRGLSTERWLNPCSMQAPTFRMCEVPATETDRRLLATVLMNEDEELTPEILEAAVRALRRIHLKREQERVQQELKKPESREIGIC